MVPRVARWLAPVGLFLLAGSTHLPLAFAQAAVQHHEMMVQSVTSEDEPIWGLHWSRQGDSLFRHLVLQLNTDAAIVIPFPQRDVNIRTDDGDPIPSTVDTVPQPKQDLEEDQES